MTDNGDGTITDPRTGLMWEQVGPTKPYAHAAAIQRCADLTLAGHTDWRLPTRTELVSLVDDERSQPAIDPVITCQSSFYWSATTYQFFPSGAWYVHFNDGLVYADGKSSNFFVRGVRGVEKGEKP